MKNTAKKTFDELTDATKAVIEAAKTLGADGHTFTYDDIKKACADNFSVFPAHLVSAAAAGFIVKLDEKAEVPTFTKRKVVAYTIATLDEKSGCTYSEKDKATLAALREFNESRSPEDQDKEFCLADVNKGHETSKIAPTCFNSLVQKGNLTRSLNKMVLIVPSTKKVVLYKLATVEGE